MGRIASLLRRRRAAACRAAIDGRRTCEEARRLFLSAAEEARLKAH
ncbi:DUF982 domain-containing protein [Sinorhizobium meliloti]|nr:DUF982 domain-containing protein [Sinorhizobium meliloti]